MNIKVKHGHPLKRKTPCLVLCVPEGKPQTLLKEADQALKGLVSKALRSREFSGKCRQSLLLHSLGKLPCERLLLVGLGKSKEADRETLRVAAAVAAKCLKEHSITDCALTVPEDLIPRLSDREATHALVEGLTLANYRFDRYRTEMDSDQAPPLKSVQILVSKKQAVSDVEKGTFEAQQLCRSVAFARDLVNEPGNVKSPEYLASQAREMAGEHGLKCTVLEKRELEKEGLGAMLGVAQGSVREPRLIVLQYRGGAEDTPPVALVGKGVVFDSGGISLKPGEKMDQMKMDMGGAAAVLGAFQAAALLKLPVNLVGVIPAVENMPSGSAIRPGDILTSLSGRTIEVLNTDAEGRLILADALTYVQRFEPSAVIDLATLTGACIIALGHHATAVLGNDDGLIRQLIRSGEQTGEKLWQLPLWDEYGEQIKSEVADVKNVGGRPAGTITAAAFLRKFVKDSQWAHLDIAGTAWEENGSPYRPKGATGVGVRLLVEFLAQSVSKNS